MYHHNHHTTNCIYLDLPEVLQCSNCFHIFSHRLWRVTILYIFCGHRVWSSSRIFSSMRQSGSKATDLGWEEHNMHYMAGSLHSLSMSIHVYPCLPVYLVCFIQPSPTPNPSNKTSLPNLLYPILCICSILILSCLLVSSVIVSIGPSNPYPSISIYIHLYPSIYIIYPSISKLLSRTIPYKYQTQHAWHTNSRQNLETNHEGFYETI